ncbi:MAG TPA: hypothetical protein VHE61_10810 [Opitutaceae bacterium]|nr:hypothetical protein [Opitutaceae bacterium]
MPSAPAVPAETVRPKSPPRANPTRWLYAAFAALLVILMFVGFQQFYLHGRAYPAHPFPPPLRGILILHGVLMTGWMTLFLVQPLLIASHNRKMHITLGTLGAVLAAAMVIVGLYTPIATTRVEPDIVLWGLNRIHFTAVPIFSILAFGGYVAVGIRYRRRPEIHRPMMLLATLCIMPAALDRITGLPDMYAATMWGRWFGPFFASLLIGALFLVVKTALTRAFDRRFAAGYAVQVAISLFIMRFAPTHTWERIISHFVR